MVKSEKIAADIIDQYVEYMAQSIGLDTAQALVIREKMTKIKPKKKPQKITQDKKKNFITTGKIPSTKRPDDYSSTPIKLQPIQEKSTRAPSISVKKLDEEKKKT